MNYETFFGPQAKENDGLRTYLLFESFILKLLDHDLTIQGKSLIREYPVTSQPRDGRFDAFVSSGVDAMLGPTIIEIKYSRHGAPISRFQIAQISQTFELAKKSVSGVFSVLMIYGGRTVPEQNRQFVSDELGRLGWPVDAVHFKIWDDTDIKELIRKYPTVADEIMDSLAIVRLSDLPKSISVNGGGNIDDWRKRNESHIQSLQIAFRNCELSLFIGAGVSKDAGMPDWATLLDSLLLVLFAKKLSSERVISDSDLNYIVKQYRQIDGASPLLNARYVRKGISDGTISHQEEFLSALTDALYRLTDPAKASDSPLLQQLASMCVPRRTGSRIRTVVTYNFDDLLEQCLTSKQVEHRAIFNDGDIPTKDELPIYHCHGFLPRNRSAYSGIDRSTLVFSEEGYHALFADPFHWSNLVQLSQLRESVCLMIGLSLTDPNMRRLLEIAARHNDSVRHFALMKRISKEEFLKQAETPSDTTKDSINQFLVIHHSIKEALLCELGISTVWFEEYSEVPQIIEKIQKPVAESIG